MNTLPDNDDDSVEAELREAIAFLSDKCREERVNDNSAAVRDLSNHIVRLMKELDAHLERRGKRISLAEAKSAIMKANDALLDAIYEIVPDYAADILQRHAEKHFESDQPFEIE